MSKDDNTGQCRVCGEPTKRAVAAFCSRYCANEHKVYLPTVEEIYAEAARLRAKGPIRPEDEDKPLEIREVRWKT